MKKIDMHLHLTLRQIPKIGKMNLTSGKNMIPHLEELGIGKGVLMSSGEKKVPFGNNKGNKAICDKLPEYYAWMCSFDAVNPETVYERMSLYKSQGAIGVGELTINKPLTDPMLQAIFTAAEKLDMPVTIHMSPEVGYSYGVVDEPGLPLLEEVLQKYPKLKVQFHLDPFEQ